MDTTKEYKVFISYSWTNEKHEKWVHDLATRLYENGLDVKYDKWDLKAGDDKYAFMESMTNDSSIDNVLIICDRGYKEKADSRESGVGTETQIITPELYNKTQQSKFIPIIAEKGDSIESFVPQYLKSRIFIDLSSEEVFESSYEQLLRIITGRPSFRKPAKGELPSYLFEDEKSHYKTQNINKQIKYSLEHNPDRVNSLIIEFVESFMESVDTFNLNYHDLKEPYDETIYNSVLDMIELRNDYIRFLSMLSMSNKVNIDRIINLYERLYGFTSFHGNGSYSLIQFDNIKFLIQELFLYTASILIDNEKYDDLNTMLSTKYFIEDEHSRGSSVLFGNFRFYIESLDEYRKQRLKSNKISITAELLIERSVLDGKSYKNKILETDLLLHYISVIKFGEHEDWFPTTYVYAERYQMKIIARLVSKRHFEKVKILFNVNNINEMKNLITNFQRPYKGYNSGFSSIPNLKNYVKVDEIGEYA